MRQKTNNEIDLLLRRMGRDGVPRNSEARGGDRHLDADELSSYAQNALPAAARAHYTEHLADCATCRRLVTELSLSLGAAAAPVAATHEPGGFKTFLASLFSPLVLRYAVPALGVIVVMIVGFVVLRQQRQQEFVAQVQDNKAPVAAPSSPTTPAEGFIEQPKQENGQLQNSNARPNETKHKTESAAAEASGGAGAGAPAPVTKDEGTVAESKVAASATPTPAAATAATGAANAATPQANIDAVARKPEEQAREKTLDEVKA